MELDNKVLLENEKQTKSVIKTFRDDYHYYGFGTEDVKEYPCVLCWHVRYDNSENMYPNVDYAVVYQEDFNE